MEWTCKYCNIIFIFEKFQQRGAHTRNCIQNPKKQEMNNKISISIKKIWSVPKFEIITTCLTCKKEILQTVSQNKIDKNNIKYYCNRNCFNNRVISKETRDKLSSAAALLRQDDGNFEKNRAKEFSKSFKDKRIKYQNIGRERIKLGEPLYVAGCMLYWGEGNKGINSVQLTNSDVNLILFFKKFLTECFGVLREKFILNINCYTDLHPKEEIEIYWLNILNLDRANLRKTLVNILPKSSKNSKINKLEYGTVRITIHKTEIVQEIFGAIQEFGSFSKIEWLDHKSNNKI